LAHDLVITLNVAIVCSTLLIALFMTRRSIDRVSRQKHSVFMLMLPFGITWMIAGGDNSAEIEEVVKVALLRRTRNSGPKGGARPPALEQRHRTTDAS
jgi:hypothetical protein